MNKPSHSTPAKPAVLSNEQKTTAEFASVYLTRNIALMVERLDVAIGSKPRVEIKIHLENGVDAPVKFEFDEQRGLIVNP